MTNREKFDNDSVIDPLIPSQKLSLYDPSYIAIFHVLPAILLTLGRVFIGSGMSLFNFEKTTESFGWHDKSSINALAYFIVITTAIDTLIGRGTANFLRCSPPAIYISDIVINEKTSLDNVDKYFPMTLFRETYVIRYSDIDDKAYLYRRDNDKIKNYSLNNDDVQKTLNALYKALNTKVATQNTPILLSVDDIQNFYKIKDKQKPPKWSTCTTALYWKIFVPAASTAIFSSLAAILYLYTFAKKFDNSVIFDGVFVAFGVIVNFLTYCYFNIRNMNENITNACQRYQDGESFKIVLFGKPKNQKASQDTTKQIIFTCVLATLGMIGNLSAAYYVMFKLLDLPAARDICEALNVPVESTAMTLAIFNMYGSFFSGIFNMAMNAHRLITEEKTTPRTTIDTVLSLNTLFNATVNAMQSFLGTAQLTGQKTIHWDSTSSVSLFAFRVMITLGYLYLTYGMMRQGNERSIQYFNQKATHFNCNRTDYQVMPTEDPQTQSQDDVEAQKNNSSTNCTSPY